MHESHKRGGLLGRVGIAKHAFASATEASFAGIVYCSYIRHGSLKVRHWQKTLPFSMACKSDSSSPRLTGVTAMLDPVSIGVTLMPSTLSCIINPSAFTDAQTPPSDNSPICVVKSTDTATGAVAPAPTTAVAVESTLETLHGAFANICINSAGVRLLLSCTTYFFLANHRSIRSSAGLSFIVAQPQAARTSANMHMTFISCLSNALMIRRV
jgi:hypothetical protein